MSPTYPAAMTCFPSESDMKKSNFYNALHISETSGGSEPATNKEDVSCGHHHREDTRSSRSHTVFYQRRRRAVPARGTTISQSSSRFIAVWNVMALSVKYCWHCAWDVARKSTFDLGLGSANYTSCMPVNSLK
ncbi:hypothetical protein RRG08_031916 [Elysia crispata]|uniref:Uncharacterized protein n=1 Tax=Elysia crispata TaxID=231223 RepID=A0AAE1AHD5_9GAST|nr:hypothetical protein RRG08_031916 [Elysia crispata]